jgi:hypothetical protein
MSDSLPTNLLEVNVDALTPFIVVLFNRSLGVVPSIFNSAYIKPLLKKQES